MCMPLCVSVVGLLWTKVTLQCDDSCSSVFIPLSKEGRLLYKKTKQNKDNSRKKSGIKGEEPNYTFENKKWRQNRKLELLYLV